MSRPLAVATLLLCTFLWGIAFVFQKGAMQHIGPLTFTAIRYFIGAALVAPIAVAEYRRRAPIVGPFTARQRWQFLILITSFFAGVWAQQAGLQTTTVTNGGFLTALYVLITPFAALILLRVPPHPIIYLGAPLALIGIYLLTGADIRAITAGDTLLVLAAIFWGIQIAIIAPLVQETGMPVAISCATFFACAILAAIGVPFLETPSWNGIGSAWVEILYTGVMSTAVAFTLQAIGQQYVPPSNAAIILSSESLFAAAAGAIILHERLPLAGYAGAALIFVAIIIVETVPALAARRSVS
jgi:drug/metabolite transporter (DMT)-like permease